MSVEAINPSADIDPQLRELMAQRNRDSLAEKPATLCGLGGSLAVHCKADLDSRSVVEAASMATLFRGYEALLPGKTLERVGTVSSTASGLCGGVHATASALCLEMALGLKPPPLGIVLRNLLLSCQYLNDNSMHLFVLGGPDYSQQLIEATNPELWRKAEQSTCRFSTIHGYQRIADIMRDLNKKEGKLYKEALTMVGIARQAYVLLGGKYPHSESILPGGVDLDTNAETLEQFQRVLEPFAEYSARAAAIWDEIFAFMLDADPRYEHLGVCPADMLDFGQWDHPDHYDGDYLHCDAWGSRRWSSPGAVLDGKLVETQLSLLNAGMEESLDYSFNTKTELESADLISQDPLGNPLSPQHPWNKRLAKPNMRNPHAYSWGSSLTWRGRGFEVGAYSRLYITALARSTPTSEHLQATGESLRFSLAGENATRHDLEWRVPQIWNTFERNRARAYALAFSLAVTLDNIDIARRLLRQGDTQTRSETATAATDGRRLGVGLWGASRGFLAHWAVLEDQQIKNYQVSVPSRVNVGTRTAQGEPGPLEKALLNTPLLETGFSGAEDFQAVDLQRTLQSFDPCMSCDLTVLLAGSGQVLRKEIDTSFPI